MNAKTIYTAESKSEKEKISASVEASYESISMSVSAKVSFEKSKKSKFGNTKTKSIFS